MSAVDKYVPRFDPSLIAQLPISAVLPAIRDTLMTHHELVLEAPPGAGKTTVVPLALLEEPWLRSQKIVVLEPRRMAARAAAERMASLLGERVGETVGYRIRLENRTGPNTRIEVITEGILTRWLQDDPSLSGVALVIFDEFHERNLNTDFGLALSIQGRELFRADDEPLKLLVMSATLDGDAVAALLDDAPILRSEGKQFPVDIIYGKTLALRQSIVEPVVAAIDRALLDNTGSILVFLPGQGEIRRVAEQLRPIITANNIAVAPLYGGLTMEQQQAAIRPAASGFRKVVLATDIAETSLTIEGIATIIDAGLSRKPVFDPVTGMTRLHTQRLSSASSTQRAGRAGRMQAGRCYRLWSEDQQQQLLAHATPEILQADLLPLALQLNNWGIDDPAELRWMDPPPPAPFQQAVDLLEKLGALKRGNNNALQLTAHGQQMASLAMHPRLAHMLLWGCRYGLQRMAVELAALLSERDPFREQGADLAYRLDVLRGEIPCAKSHRPWLQRVTRQADSFMRVLKKHQIARQSTLADEQGLGFLIACAYPDRIASQRKAGAMSYRVANGRTAILNEQDALANQPWLAVAELGGRVGYSDDVIFSAASLDMELLKGPLQSLCTTVEIAEWDDKRHRFIAERQCRVGALVVENQPQGQMEPEVKIAALLALVRKRGLAILPWTDELRQWQARVELLRQLEGSELAWPDVSDQGLLATLEQWLAPFIESVNHIDDFKKLNLKNMLTGLLPWPLPQQLDELAPLRYQVPSGSSVSIDYGQSPPVLAVKLQEMFGAEHTPTVANGKVKLLVHLLSPARRPLQVTQDLAGFWRSSYQQVKKEMKGRYPKHPWPDDPLQAIATRHVKHRKH